jgi:dGTPase
MTMHWAKLLNTYRLKPRKPSSMVAGDMRDEFDRDYDRIVYSTPFRRLQDKTQVFPLDPNDAVRTRLTHSLEVSRAACGMAKDVCKQLLDRQFITTDQAKSIETIAATCGLLHDLGNPPFGHSGEVAIRDWFPTR